MPAIGIEAHRDIPLDPRQDLALLHGLDAARKSHVTINVSK